MSARGDDIDEGRSLPYQFEEERLERLARKKAAAIKFREEMDRRRAAADAEEQESLLDAAERIHGGDK